MHSNWKRTKHTMKNLILTISSLLLLFNCSHDLQSNIKIENGLYYTIDSSTEFVIDTSNLISWYKYDRKDNVFKDSEIKFKIKSRTDSLIKAVWFLNKEFVNSRINFHLIDKNRIAGISYKSTEFYNVDMVDFITLMTIPDKNTPINPSHENFLKDSFVIDNSSNSLDEYFYVLYDNNDIDLKKSLGNSFTFKNNLSYTSSPLSLSTISYNSRECTIISNDTTLSVPVIRLMKDTAKFASEYFLVYKGLNNLSPLVFKERYGIDWTGNIEEYKLYMRNQY